MFQGLKKTNISSINLSRLSEGSGVYIFWNKTEEALYVGKAKNLKNRIRSYFIENIFGKTKEMVSRAVKLSTIEVQSELEALLLEAKLIKILYPPYNMELKDDKHPLFIKITNEKYPRIITVRKDDFIKYKYLHGPFPNSESVRSVLKLLRRIFPYSQHQLGEKPCFYKELGLCNPCPNEIDREKDKKNKIKLRKIYLKNINSIRNILRGNLKKVKNDLIKSMNKYSKNKDYENAISVRDKLNKLDYITQPVNNIEKFLENPNLIEDVRGRELNELTNLLSKYFKIGHVKRIECYDIAHFSGFNPAASMVTFINAVPEKKFYRHFRIFQKKGNDDISSLREVAERRIKYLEIWGKPDLIIVDGGKGQLAIFNDIFHNKNIPIVGLAKKDETLVIADKSGFTKGYVLVKLKPGPILNLLQRIRNEAHRFARTYHHHLFVKSLLIK